MLGPLGENGLPSFFPPTVILCFTCVATYVSNFPGGDALQLASAARSRAENATRAPQCPPATLLASPSPIVLLHDIDSHVHGAMIDAAEVIANGHKFPGGLRRHPNLCGLARLNVGVDFQRADEEAMGYVLAGEPHSDRLTLLQRDLRRDNLEALGGSVHPLGRLIRFGCMAQARQHQ